MRRCWLILLGCALCLPGDDKATADPAYRLLARAYEAVNRQNHEEALTAFTEALKVTRRRHLVLKELAYTLLKLNRRADALNHFHAAMELEPTDYATALEFAYLAAELGDFSTARRVFAQVRDAGDDAQRAAATTALRNLATDTSPKDPVYPLLEVGYKALQTGDYASAITAFRQALALNPNRRRIRKDLGYAYLKLGDKTAARAELALAAEGDPFDAQAALEVAFLSLELKDPNQARQCFERVRQSGDAEAARRAEEALRNLAAPPTADPAYAWAEKAYSRLAAKDYDAAAEAFLQALTLAPSQINLRKDLAYLLLRMGENLAAREQFRLIMEADPTDFRSALEYAFLCYETRQKREARHVFDRVRRHGDPASRATAQQAFDNIDAALERGINRWLQAAAANPNNFSVHEELARLAEERDELPLAEEHYLEALRIRPEIRSLLLDLARVAAAQGRPQQAAAWYLAASRSQETRTAELAREHLPTRYPYRSEFEAALALDPSNTLLRREFAFFLLELGEPDSARRQLALLLETDPNDATALAQLAALETQLNGPAAARPYWERLAQGSHAQLAAQARRALGWPENHPLAAPTTPTPPPSPPSPTSPSPREMGFKSYDAGYLADAERYFKQAWEQDPHDFAVALQLAWTYNVAGRNEEAVRWFNVARRSPDADIASRAARAYAALTAQLAPPPSPPLSPLPAPASTNLRELALKSYERGFLNDAERYLRSTLEENPLDYEAALKLGFTYNLQRRDQEALPWFRLARQSPNQQIAADAQKAYQALRKSQQRLQSTLWAFPIFSTRWNAAFAYSQLKTELKFKKLPLYPYLSARFVGDSQSVTGGPFMPYLSETSGIFGLGLRTSVWRGFMAWGEAGAAVSYRRRSDVGAIVSDYRAGLAFFRVFGRGLGSESPGRFYETNFDAVYVSRFDNNLLFIDQNRLGYTFSPIERLHHLQLQLLWNTNLTVDARRQAWANFAEFGPGLQFRLKNWPPPLRFSVHWLRGVYLKNEGNQFRPNFFDLRLGMWYAFSR